MKEIAVFVAGNKNIVKQAIVSLISMKKYNSNIDTFLLVNREEITKKELEILNKYNIKIPDFKFEFDFSSSNRWPKEVFLNYYAPIILNKLGYKYSLKIDCDTLCSKKIDFKDIMPKENQSFSAYDTGYEVDYYLKEEREFLIKEFKYNKSKLSYTYPNVGVILFNNELYIKNKIWEKIYEYNIRIKEKSEKKSLDIIFADQALFAIVLSTNENISWKKISCLYNFTVHEKNFYKIYDEDINKVFLFHYTGVKPWEKIGLRDILSNPYALTTRKYYFLFLKELNIFNNKLDFLTEKVKNKKYLFDYLVENKLFIIWLYIWKKLSLFLKKIN